MKAATRRKPRRYERLKKLTPQQAIQAWMDADFRVGEEEALLFAIRNGTNTKISDTALEALIWESIDAEEDAKTCLLKIDRHIRT